MGINVTYVLAQVQYKPTYVRVLSDIPYLYDLGTVHMLAGFFIELFSVHALHVNLGIAILKSMKKPAGVLIPICHVIDELGSIT